MWLQDSSGLPPPRDRTELIARTRKDARLGFRAPQPSRRFYALSTFTPEQVRAESRHPQSRKNHLIVLIEKAIKLGDKKTNLLEVPP